MKKIRQWWHDSPKVRFIARTIAVAVGGYVVQTIRSGNPWTWSALITGAGTAAFTAVAGFFSPLEPFVGVNKAKIAVPTPPADPTTHLKA